jgi:UDP-N-acetylglucosamine 2-epimerase
MKLVTILGARPQFIKAAPVSKALKHAGQQEFLLHTGQHYDYNMSQVFFDELQLPQPDVNLGIGSGPHGEQTARMLTGIEQILIREKPDWVLVYGDTNSTLAGALAAVKLHLPLAHVEAGLRSFNRLMPEEHNRVLTDHCSDLLLCPTQTALDNLAREGLPGSQPGTHVAQVGDTMYDAVLHFAQFGIQHSRVLRDLGIIRAEYLLATVHRQENTDNVLRLQGILEGLRRSQFPVVFPVHPRTRARLIEMGLIEKLAGTNLRLIEPLGYLDMLVLEQNARQILTDSGGMQKEAFFFSVPCITMRDETEWIETVQSGWNILVGADAAKIEAALNAPAPEGITPPQIFGDGHAAEKIACHLTEDSGFNPQS